MNQSNNKEPKIVDCNQPRFQLEFLKPQYWKIWLLIGLCILLSMLPYNVLNWIGKQISKVFATSNLKVIKYRRHIARVNIDLAFADREQEFRDKVYTEFCQKVGLGMTNVIVSWFYSSKRFAKIVKIPTNVLDDYYLKKHYIYLAGHFLNIEGTGRSLGLIKPSYGNYLKNSNKLWDYLQCHFRVRDNLAMVPNDNFKKMIAVIKQKQGMFYAPDQDLGDKTSVYVPFFADEHTCTTKGTFYLYRIFPDIVLLPVVLIPSTDPKFKLEFKVLEPLTFTEDETPESVASKTNKTIEKMIEYDYSNYMWFHRRFHHRIDNSYVYDVNITKN